MIRANAVRCEQGSNEFYEPLSGPCLAPIKKGLDRGGKPVRDPIQGLGQSTSDVPVEGWT